MKVELGMMPLHYEKNPTLGLAVAVPAVLAYNWLQRRNKAIAEDLSSFSNDVLGYMASDGAVRPSGVATRKAAAGTTAAATRPAAGTTTTTTGGTTARPAATTTAGQTGGVQHRS